MAKGPGEILESVLPLLAAARFAFVFGSFGTPAFGEESDLDLAVDLGRKLASRERFDLGARLDEAAGRRVDLVDLRSSDPIIAMQVLKTGRPFLVNDPAALAVFRMTTPSRYFDWKISRRPVEASMWKAAGA